MDEHTKGQLNFLKNIIAKAPGNLYWKDKNGVYLGCNDGQARFLGFSSGEEIIGKKDDDLPWKAEAPMLRENDLEVMKKKEAFTKEERITLSDGTSAIFFSKKEPLFDAMGQVVGIVGTSLDITELKKALAEATDAKARMQEQEKFTKNANQVAHDIRSPLASLLMIIKACNEIPEMERVALREAAISIGDIANNLLSKYKTNESETTPVHIFERQPVLLSAILLQLLTDKKFQYNDLPVKFDYDFHQRGEFAFIHVEPSPFKRMISNLINNAVDAFDGQEGEVTLKLDATKDKVHVMICDNGKGMPPEIIEKIIKNIAFTQGKSDGHGIGLTQVRETLQNNAGTLSIESTVGQGTQITITFPRITAPTWIAEEICLRKDDIVIILDDDASIHIAWDARFELVRKQAPNIQVHHFEFCQKAIDFIKSLNEEDFKKVFLLTDFELLKQELNGLHVVEKTKVERSILVTSHYANVIVLERAETLKTKILPKQLASEVPITMDETVSTKQDEQNGTSLKVVDLILVDDDRSFAQTLITYIFVGDTVDYFQDPKQLKENIQNYSKDTRIYLDNNFASGGVRGIDVAKELHELGFSRLYLLSGDVFSPGELPDYLTGIMKDQIDKIKDW